MKTRDRLFAAVAATSLALPASAQTQDAATAAALAQAQLAVAQAQAREEQIKAAQAAMPGSGITNSATAGTDAGLAEANYLSAIALQHVASRIVTDIANGPDKRMMPSVLTLFPGAEAPDLSQWQLFSGEITEIGRLFDRAKEDQAAATPPPPPSPPPKPKPQPHVGVNNKPGGYQIGKPYPVSGTIMFAQIPQLLSYLGATESLSGTKLATQDTILINALAGRFKTNHYAIYIYSQTFNRSGAERINKMIADVREKYDAALPEITKYANAQTKPNFVLEYQAASSRLSALLSRLTTTTTKPPSSNGDTTVTPDSKPKGNVPATIDATDTQGTPAVKLSLPPLSLAELIKEASIGAALERGHGLFVKIQSMTGSTFTDKNLLTFFGANAYSVSASTVVSYSLIDSAGDDVIWADTVQAIIPYTGITEVTKAAVH